MNRTSTLKEVLDVTCIYANNLEKDLTSLTLNWPDKLRDPKLSRVLIAMLARQTTLSTYVAKDSFFWNSHTAAFLLRPMLENWLKIEWILESPAKRAQGLAKADLLGAINRFESIEHLSNVSPIVDAHAELVGLLEDEINRFDENIKPIVIDTRAMALALGKDKLIEYRKYFVQLSSCVHSTWNFLAANNLSVNPNPLHKFNYVASWNSGSCELDAALLSAELCDRTYAALGFKTIVRKSSYEQLIESLEEMGLIEQVEIN